jgi:hypothetical protein
MGAVVFRLQIQGLDSVSPEMLDFAGHLADLLAEDYARRMKETADEGSSVRTVLEREPTGTEHQ